MIDAKDVVEAIETGVELPSLSRAVVQLLAVMSDPNHSRRQVQRIVRSEPGIVADALRMANSGMVRHRTRPVESADEAISILGEMWLMRAVTARSFKTLNTDALEGYGMDVDGLWEHSIRVALIAEQLAPRVGVHGPVAYTAGLLVDVGKLVASGALASLGARVDQTLARRTDLSFDAVERMLLGVDHAELGARVAEAWDLPASLVAALRFHHQPDQAQEHIDIVQVVHAADSIAYLTGRGLGVDGMLYRMTNEPLPSLVMDRRDVDGILLSTEQKVQHIEALMAG